VRIEDCLYPNLDKPEKIYPQMAQISQIKEKPASSAKSADDFLVFCTSISLKRY